MKSAYSDIMLVSVQVPQVSVTLWCKEQLVVDKLGGHPPVGCLNFLGIPPLVKRTDQVDTLWIFDVEILFWCVAV